MRLYPVPFRLISDDKQFKKWQWVNMRVEKAKKDHRPESHKVFVDTIKCDPYALSTADNWRERQHWIAKCKIYQDFAALEADRKAGGPTLGLLRPARILGVDISPADKKDWTEEERKKLLHMQHQGELFDDTDAKSITTLRKLPFDFHYRYACQVNGTAFEYRHKISDWEIGALFWNVRQRHRANWEAPFKEKVETYMSGRDLIFLMGTIHRFPDQWLIISLIYPPKLPLSALHQGSLL